VTTPSNSGEESLTTETQRTIAQRLSLGAATFAIVLVLAWIGECQAHPDRGSASTWSVGFELLTLGVTVWLLRRPALWAYSRPLGVAAVALLMAQISAYQISVGEGDVLNVALLYLVAGTMVLVPWGWQGQLPVALTALGTFVAAVALGVHTATALTINLVGLAAFCALSVGAAAFLAQQRRASWEQAEALRRTNTALEAANRAKNQFIATVSHELRTPVSVILGYGELLVDGEFGEVPAEARGVLVRILRNGRNLAYLVSDLLDLARIEAGRLAVKREPVDLAPVFVEVADFAASRLEGKSVRLVVEAPEALQVMADCDRLQQVLVNLLSNAAKFTDRGEIRLRAQSVDDTHVAVEVSDTGPGIDPVDLAHIFEPFEQGAAGKKRGGVGMGLYLSASLARAMGGALSVDSEVGRGSTFVLRLRSSRTSDPLPHPA
jgi:signal transduction histidine kinase